MKRGSWDVIIVLLKDKSIEKIQVPAVSGDQKKFIAGSDELVFELKLNKKGKNASKTEYNISETTDRRYIFNKSDIVAEVDIDDSKLLIVSGNIKII